MNFNLGDQTHDSEYELFRSTTEEVINLYGVPIKYAITEKINQNEIFGEHSHIKVDNNSIYTLYTKPASTDMWEGESNIFSRFGLQNMNTIEIFVSRTDMERIHPDIVNRNGDATVDNLPIGNLVIFDSNKIMEVTGFELASADFGNNNIFTSDRNKNVYKLILASYFFNRDDISAATDITDSDNYEYNDFGNLESIFNNDEEYKNEEEHRSNDDIIEDEVIYPNKLRKKPVRDKDKETNPFGEFG